MFRISQLSYIFAEVFFTCIEFVQTSGTRERKIVRLYSTR
jgi:hypothetical protein